MTVKQVSSPTATPSDKSPRDWYKKGGPIPLLVPILPQGILQIPDLSPLGGVVPALHTENRGRAPHREESVHLWCDPRPNRVTVGTGEGSEMKTDWPLVLGLVTPAVRCSYSNFCRSVTIGGSWQLSQRQRVMDTMQSHYGIISQIFSSSGSLFYITMVFFAVD